MFGWLMPSWRQTAKYLSLNWYFADRESLSRCVVGDVGVDQIPGFATREFRERKVGDRRTTSTYYVVMPVVASFIVRETRLSPGLPVTSYFCCWLLECA